MKCIECGDEVRVWFASETKRVARCDNFRCNAGGVRLTPDLAEANSIIYGLHAELAAAKSEIVTLQTDLTAEKEVN